MRKILFFQWNAFMQKGIERAFTYLGMEYDTFYYIFKDWDKDDDFKEKFKKRLQSGKEEYEYVFSVNFSPLISEVCNDLKSSNPYHILINQQALYMFRGFMTVLFIYEIKNQ